MAAFNIGQKVQLASNPDLVFQITAINPDQTFEIKVYCSELEYLHYHNISAEMLRLKED